MVLLLAAAMVLPVPAQAQNVVTTIQSPAGGVWGGMALYQTGHKLFVSDQTDHRILVFDTVSLAQSEIAMTAYPPVQSLVVHEGTGTLYAVVDDGFATSESTIVVIDANTYAIGSTLKSIGLSLTAVVDQTRNRLYTFGDDSLLKQKLTAIDINTNTVVGSLDVESLMPNSGLLGFDSGGGLNPVTGELVITNLHMDQFAIINGPALTAQVISAAGSRGWTGVWNTTENKVYITTIGWTGYFSYDRDTASPGLANCVNDGTYLFFSSGRDRVYSGAEIDGNIAVIDGNTDACQLVSVGKSLPVVDFAATRGHAYAAGYNGVMVLDENTLTSVAWFPIPSGTGGGTIGARVVVEPSSQRVFVRSSWNLTDGKASALLVVDDIAPLITAQPQPQSILPGNSALLSVAATGKGTVHYQWYEGFRGDTSIPVGSDSAVLVTSLLDRTTAFWVRVSDDLGHGDSLDATVTVDANFGSWTPQKSGTTEPLYGVCFVDQYTGWAVGGWGTVKSTSDGGATWKSQMTMTTQTLFGVFFADSKNGWAVGDAGTVTATTDGGATWNPQSSGTTTYLKNVYFIDKNTGWIVGSNTLLSTTDGGITWTLSDGGSGTWLYGVSFADGATGWAVGSNGSIVHTTDGGKSWAKQDSGSTALLEAVDFVGLAGWTVGKACILSTTDGGSHWVRQDGGGIAQTLRGVDFVSAKLGWAVGDTGLALKTIDGGAGWFPEYTGTTKTLNAVHFVDVDTGWAVGTLGTILKHTRSLPQFELSISKTGTGTDAVNSSPAGIDCGPKCAGPFDLGTVVTLTAKAGDGSVFTEWGGACSGTGTCVVAMDADKLVTARFASSSGGAGGGTGGTGGGGGLAGSGGVGGGVAGTGAAGTGGLGGAAPGTGGASTGTDSAGAGGSAGTGGSTAGGASGGSATGTGGASTGPGGTGGTSDAIGGGGSGGGDSSAGASGSGDSGAGTATGGTGSAEADAGASGTGATSVTTKGGCACNLGGRSPNLGQGLFMVVMAAVGFAFGRRKR